MTIAFSACVSCRDQDQRERYKYMGGKRCKDGKIKRETLHSVTTLGAALILFSFCVFSVCEM